MNNSLIDIHGNIAKPFVMGSAANIGVIEGVNRVHHSNFLNNNLPDKCANLIIADPPYFEVKGAFDFVWEDMKAYLLDVEKWAIECKRLLADNGTLFWYGHAKKIAYAQIIFDKYFNLENSLIWEKTSGAVLQGTKGLRCFTPLTERILMYSSEPKNNNEENFFESFDVIRSYLVNECEKADIKTKKQYENILASTNKSQHHLSKSHFHLITELDYLKLQEYCVLNKKIAFLKPHEQLKFEYEQTRRPFSNVNEYTDVLKFKSETHITGKYDHETCKPETLTRALILTCSRPNDLVFIPFAGSGTEVAMSVKEGRRAIGYDIESKYVEMSNRRVQAILMKPELFH